jgi:hypothetical protein
MENAKRIIKNRIQLKIWEKIVMEEKIRLKKKMEENERLLTMIRFGEVRVNRMGKAIL